MSRTPFDPIVTTVDDRGVRFDYGAGSALLRAPMVAGNDGDADRLALFDRHFRELPDRIAKAGGRRLSDGPPMHVPLPKAPPRYDKAAACKLPATYAAPTCDKEEQAIGAILAGYRVTRTDGHVALLTHDPAATGAPLRLQASPEAPVRLVMTPAFWRAYTRVRTCRPKSGCVGFDITAEAVEIYAEDAEGECSARERVPDAARDASWRVFLDDRLLWPLRGVAGDWRHVIPEAPIWVGGLEPAALLLMPMRKAG